MNLQNNNNNKMTERTPQIITEVILFTVIDSLSKCVTKIIYNKRFAMCSVNRGNYLTLNDCMWPFKDFIIKQASCKSQNRVYRLNWTKDTSIYVCVRMCVWAWALIEIMTQKIMLSLSLGTRSEHSIEQI